ncbi:hypothetical protein [Methylocystis echinoides]|uniref:Uncharacterized protein n=1 Tax=Methylocystis echinoides TaxID=29468 RepID=A0A9W6GTR6_9HYPH|nr:hypothetical protein [Methylocystis echinoides]GLI92879.1 hypothetical protein LMG27198_18710 [Methylocystis echinoides]
MFIFRSPNLEFPGHYTKPEEKPKDQQGRYPEITSPQAQNFNLVLTQTQPTPVQAMNVTPVAPPSPKRPAILDRLESIPCDDGRSAKVVVFAGRPIVAVRIGQVLIPFYISSGENRKEGVTAGQWYPFFGIGGDGWLNKSDRIGTYYGSDKLREVARQLDKNTGALSQSTVVISTDDKAPMRFLNADVPGLPNIAYVDTLKAIAEVVRAINADKPPEMSGAEMRKTALAYYRENGLWDDDSEANEASPVWD